MKTAHIALGGIIASLLAGCQTLDAEKATTMSVYPVQTVHHSTSRPEAQYAIGRYLQGQLRYAEAIATYRRLLESYPNHADAHNALGLILAAQGKYEMAITEFEAAAAAAPKVIGIRNNLGYAYLLHGNAEKAITTLEAAQTLDPSHQRVRDNLTMAQASVKAEANRTPEPTAAPEAVASSIQVTPAPASAGASQLVAVSDNVYAVSAAAAPSPQPVSTSVTQPAPASEKPARLEVSNANGITGLASDTARQLAADGYTRPRLTNEPPYQLPATEIQYRPGFEAQAQQLQESLRHPVPMAPSNALRWDVQLRLVLGKDVKSSGELVKASL